MGFVLGSSLGTMLWRLERDLRWLGKLNLKTIWRLAMGLENKIWRL